MMIAMIGHVLVSDIYRTEANSVHQSIKALFSPPVLIPPKFRTKQVVNDIILLEGRIVPQKTTLILASTASSPK